MHIRVITPITTPGFTGRVRLRAACPCRHDRQPIELDVGPASIESAFDEALALPDTIAKIVQAEQEGVDAVVVDCFGDPGVDAGREATEMLVLGPAQTSMHLAALLGQKFSVVTVLEAVVPMLEDLATKYGLADKLCSIRTSTSRCSSSISTSGSCVRWRTRP